MLSGDSNDLSAIQDKTAQLVRAYQGLESQAPDELADDIRAMAVDRRTG